MTDKPVQSFVSYASDSNYEQGLRPYFVYRDLGIKDATDGKVLAHIIRANQSCDGAMGYHSHALFSSCINNSTSGFRMHSATKT